MPGLFRFVTARIAALSQGLGLAVDDVMRHVVYPENRTVKIVKALEYVEVPLQPRGPYWLNGHYVVDACYLTGVQK